MYLWEITQDNLSILHYAYFVFEKSGGGVFQIANSNMNAHYLYNIIM